MFVVIDMSDERKRIFEKRRKHNITLIRHDVKGCAPFFVAKCHRKYTDINELRALVECYGVALFPDEGIIPEEMKHLSFEPEVLPLKMLVKTVGNCLSQKNDGYDLTLSIVDPGAKCCDVIREVVNKVRYVRVITSRCDRYEMCVSQIFVSQGIKIDVTSDYSCLNGSDIVICVDDSLAKNADCKKIICFNKSDGNPLSTALFETKAAYSKFDSRQYGISPFRFLCALYETCGYPLKQPPLFDNTQALIDYFT